MHKPCEECKYMTCFTSDLKLILTSFEKRLKYSIVLKAFEARVPVQFSVGDHTDRCHSKKWKEDKIKTKWSIAT